MSNDEITTVLNMTPEEQDRYFASLPPDGTSTKLVEDLLKKPETEERNKMIEMAKAYWYDDFKSLNPAICPKISLYEDLGKLGYTDLMENVRDGKYD